MDVSQTTFQLRESKSSARNPKRYPPYEIYLINRKKQIPQEVYTPKEITLTGYYLQTNNAVFPCFYLQNIKSEYLLIHSHANAPDMGIVLDNYLDLSDNLEINIIGYDYVGYGQSEGYPDDIMIIEQIKKVYEFSRHQLGYNWNKIILYGQSIGSGPSTIMASLYSYPVLGLILHSPFLSGLRTFFQMGQTSFYDIFPNQDYLQYVQCYVLIIHGANDKQVPFYHAQDLANRSSRLYDCLIIDDAGHNNIEFKKEFRQIYYYKLREFFEFLKFQNNDVNKQSLQKQLKASKWPTSLNHIYNKNSLNKQESINISSSSRTSQIELQNSVSMENQLERGLSQNKAQFGSVIEQRGSDFLFQSQRYSQF